MEANLCRDCPIAKRVDKGPLVMFGQGEYAKGYEPAGRRPSLCQLLVEAIASLAGVVTVVAALYGAWQFGQWVCRVWQGGC